MAILERTLTGDFTTILMEADGQIRLSAITSGGSQAVFFKVNTLGAESFLDTIRDTVERFAPGAH